MNRVNRETTAFSAYMTRLKMKSVRLVILDGVVTVCCESWKASSISTVLVGLLLILQRHSSGRKIVCDFCVDVILTAISESQSLEVGRDACGWFRR